MPSLALAGAGPLAPLLGAVAAATGHAVTAVTDPDDHAAQSLALGMEVPAVRVRDLPAGADVVVVSGDPHSRPLLAMASWQGGAPVVVCDVPLAATLADADRLVDASAWPERGAPASTLVYGQPLAFAPALGPFVQAVEGLGPLTRLTVRVHQPRPTQPDRLTGAWGGGALTDEGAQAVGLALSLIAPDRPVAVSATVTPDPDVPVEGAAQLSMRCTSGLVVHVDAAWADGPAVADVEAVSESGVARLELAPSPGLEVNGEPVDLPAPVGALPDERLEVLGYASMLRAVVDGVADGHLPTMGAVAGRDVLEVVLAAAASAHDGGEEEPLPFAGPRDRTVADLLAGR